MAKISESVAARFNLQMNPAIYAHRVDLAFAFTDYKVQRITFNKLIVMLNKQEMRHDLAMLYVGISRVRKIEDLRICRLDVNNEDAIKHLLKIKRPEFIRLWRATYDYQGVWRPEKLAYARIASKKNLIDEFLNADIETVPMNELGTWFARCNIAKPRGKKGKERANLIMILREHMVFLHNEIEAFHAKNEASLRSSSSRTTSERSDSSHARANRSGHAPGMCSLVGSL